ncbi:hypothetical protein F4677DRAFT_124096 [Hypoxylon crocopeplum]|nr:hypothetical protein F4677DRAFT_124096 [Hypoxylon crocopeplum]
MAVDKKVLVEAADSFPTSQPALRLKTGFSEKLICGDIFTGSTLVAVPLLPGTLESVGNFEPKIKFTISNATDWFSIDADKTHGRLCVKALCTDDKGLNVSLTVDGIVTINETTMPLVFGLPDAKTAPFGFGIESVKFATGHEEYKALENMVFVGSQRFVKEEGDIIGVEARISQIMPGSGFE